MKPQPRPRKAGSSRPIVRTVPKPSQPSELLPLGEAAFHGLAGEIVREIEPHSEADPAAILFQLLAAVGNAIGRGPNFEVEADRHACNVFVAIVGDTASARKGSSWGQARRLVIAADPEWADLIKTGASSGEGLIAEVRDSSDEDADEVGGKRMLVVEPELASVLERMSGSGNTLSAILRQAWDGGKLDALVKKDRVTATDAHISLIGHITAEELARKLTATEQANGFANRILWVYSQRSKLLPRGGDLRSVEWEPYVDRLRAVMGDGKARTLDFDKPAWGLWEQVYEELSTPPPGLLGAIVARAPAQVRRLAVIYAVLDRAKKVGVEHLRAALAVWRYSADSAALLFGDAVGDPVADLLLSQIREAEGGIRLTELHKALGGHRSSDEIGRALKVLADLGLVRQEREGTGGRPGTRWSIADPKSDRPRPKRRAKKAKKAK